MKGINYPVGDFLIRIKNASIAGKNEIVSKNSKMIFSVAKAMQRLGVLDQVEKEKDMIRVRLTIKNKKPLMTDIKLVSKPGLRIYKDKVSLERRKKPSFLIISTSLGILSDKEAIEKNVGGEIVAEIL